jgi:hypothetical protein
VLITYSQVQALEDEQGRGYQLQQQTITFYGSTKSPYFHRAFSESFCIYEKLPIDKILTTVYILRCNLLASNCRLTGRSDQTLMSYAAAIGN